MIFKVDDKFHSHPKVLEVSLAAVGLWVFIGSWCAKYSTDGFIPQRIVRSFSGGDDYSDDYLVNELVQSGLWIAVDGGYQISAEGVIS